MKPNDDLRRDPVHNLEKIKTPNCGFDRYEPFFPFLPLAKTISYGFKLPTVVNKHPSGISTQCQQWTDECPQFAQTQISNLAFYITQCSEDL